MTFKKQENDYIDVGSVLLYVFDHKSIVARGLVIIEGKGFELTLFHPKPEAVAFCVEKGWTPPVATGSLKSGEVNVYYVKAYPTTTSVALKLSLVKADDKEDKLSAGLFYPVGSDDVLQGKVQTRLAF